MHVFLEKTAALCKRKWKYLYVVCSPLALSDMMESVPVIASYGVYYDTEGNCYAVDGQTPYAESVDCYFMLRYNNLSTERREELFEVYH